VRYVLTIKKVIDFLRKYFCHREHRDLRKRTEGSTFSVCSVAGFTLLMQEV
jgi:hypothetical protein